MAVNDIVGQSGDAQDFILEIPAGNVSHTPSDIVFGSDGDFACVEIPLVVGGGGGGNIFIMSE